MNKLTTTQRLWIKLFIGNRDLPYGSVFIIMFLNKLKVLSNKQLYDERDKMMDTIYLWDNYNRLNRTHKDRKQSARNDSYSNKIAAPKSIKPTKSR